jgi:hypothetical protein
LQAARRVDWRFLLPEPELGRVGYLGRPDPELETSCTLFATSFERTGGGRAEYDVVVLSHPSRHDLEQGAAAAAAGGWLYAEVRGFRSRGLVAALLRRGFEDVAVHLHLPSFWACEEIVPLEQGALRSVLERRRARSRGKAWLGRVLLRTRTLRLVLPCASVIARNPRRPAA